MANVIVYSGPGCPYCDRAKALLRKKGVEFREIDVRADKSQLSDMMSKTGGRKSIPQIFINDRYVGDCDELHALDAQGKLDPLLAS